MMSYFQKRQEPTMTMILSDPNQREQAALETVRSLTSEQTELRSRLYRTPREQREQMSERIASLERQIRRALDELRRARAGAPPAPPRYDPDAHVTTSPLGRARNPRRPKP
jgi:hypothetical protein